MSASEILRASRRSGGMRACGAHSTGDGLAGVGAVAGGEELEGLDGSQPAVRAFAADHADLADAARDHAVAELEAQAASGDDVVLDDAPAPGASRDGEADGGDALAVEPSAPDAVGRVSEDADAVDGVLGRDDDPVTGAKLRLLDRPCHGALFQDRVDGTGAHDHGCRCFPPSCLPRSVKIVSISIPACDSAPLRQPSWRWRDSCKPPAPAPPSLEKRRPSRP